MYFLEEELDDILFESGVSTLNKLGIIFTIGLGTLSLAKEFRSSDTVTVFKFGRLLIASVYSEKIGNGKCFALFNTKNSGYRLLPMKLYSKNKDKRKLGGYITCADDINETKSASNIEDMLFVYDAAIKEDKIVPNTKINEKELIQFIKQALELDRTKLSKLFYMTSALNLLFT